MSGPAKAVFLSYASQDGEAARNICAALRRAGIEVWFDQSELRGGDAWDANIRRQIKECALFVPIISGNTQARREGYFRREWNLACDRLLDMTRGSAFLLPVVVDATPDRDALVPEEFRSYQWTRIGSADSLDAFCARAGEMLSTPASGGTRSSASEKTGPHVATASANLRPPTGRRYVRGIVTGAVAAVIAIAGYTALRPAPQAPANPASTRSPATQPPKDFAAAKSVAVLAFANFGGNRDNEYFSDGITEELLNVLAKVPGLRVAARTSSFYFKDKSVPIPEIAAKLNVAYVVEGSVQQQGSRVKITAQLINAASGFQLWSDIFTRELKDVFALQDEIAGLIAKNLQLSLGTVPRVTKTVDPEAYRLVLEGRYFWNQRSEAGFTQAEASLTKALQIDSQYAEAHSALGAVYLIREVYRQTDGLDRNPADVDRARVEAQRALELDAALAEPKAVLGYSLQNQGRLRESEKEFQEALAFNPNDAVLHAWYALTLSASGRLDAAQRELEQASQLDPLSFNHLQIYAKELAFARQFEAALRIGARATALRTDIFIPSLGAEARGLWALGRKNEAVEKARLVRRNGDLRPRWDADSSSIHVLRQAGFPQQAADFAEEVFQRLPAESHARGFVLAALGRFDEALPFLEKSPAAPRRHLFYDTMWDPWRNDPRFQQLMVKLGCAEEYKTARGTLERMLREQQAKQ